MQQAILDGVPGVVDLRFMLRSGLDGEWRGTFILGCDRAALRLERMRGDRGALLETTLEEERRILPVTITSATDGGLVYFRSDARSVPTDRPSHGICARVGPGHELCPPGDHAGETSPPAMDPRGAVGVHDRGGHLGRAARG